MKTLYIECNMGAAGDMLMAALLELCPNPDTFIEEMNRLGIPGVRVSRSSVVKCGIRGTGVNVSVDGFEEGESQTEEAPPHHKNASEHVHSHEHGGDHHHHHRNEQTAVQSHRHSSLGDVGAMIASLAVSENVKAHAEAVYSLIAEAESAAHGVPVGEIHFHEVGTLDAVADIVGVCLLMETLAPEQIVVSPVHVGSGQVRCMHGVLPVPAPATAYILRGLPIYSGAVRGELCTPTGAALLRHFADRFAVMPMMQVERIGYGMGKKDFEAANCVRAFWGDVAEDGQYQDEIVQISCNLDDMTPEAIAFAAERLMDKGALDTFTVPIYMKKNRPAYMLVCLCPQYRAREMALLMLEQTTTNGVRQSQCSRYKLKAEFELRNTSFGQVRIKTSSGYGIRKSKPEYEDVARYAKEHDAPFETVYRAILREEPL